MAYPPLHVVELLEEILSNLEPLQIVSAQSVNRTWRNVITSSPRLRQAAWLSTAAVPTLDIDEPPTPSDADLGLFREGIKEGDDEAMGEMLGQRLKAVGINPIIVALLSANLSLLELPGYVIHVRRRTREIDNPNYADWNAETYTHMAFTLAPGIVEVLHNWCERNKNTKHIWGDMALSRPGVQSVVICPMIVEHRVALRIHADGKDLTMRDFMRAVQTPYGYVMNERKDDPRRLEHYSRAHMEHVAEPVNRQERT